MDGGLFHVKRQGKLTEEAAADRLVSIAKRVQRNHPDEASVGMLVAAAATLLLAGFTDPRDRHVVHAAERMRDRLDGMALAAARGDGPTAADKLTELRPLTEGQRAIVAGVRPVWEEMRAQLLERIPESTYRLWIEPVILCGRHESTLLLHAPPGIHAWCERRYTGLLEQAVGAVTKGDVDRVRFVHWLPDDVQTCNGPDYGGTESPPREQGGQHP